MFDQDREDATLRHRVEKGVSRQKWMYRIIFFLMHILFYAVSMLVVWGTLGSNPALRDFLFNGDAGGSVIVTLPTIMWAAVILFHAASLITESSAGEKAIREKLLMREVGEEFLRRAIVDDTALEKPKRRSESWDSERARLSDDGELIAVDEHDDIEERDQRARTH
jgi:hypothetical protein